MLLINARFRSQPATGVQRYARETIARLAMPLREIAPDGASSGLRGHLWEQTALALAAGSAPLWSPCNSGPVLASRHLVTIHDAAPLDHPEWFTPPFVALYRLLWPALARTARIVTVSEFSRQRLAERLRIAPERVSVVPPGVGPPFAPASREEIARLRASFDLGTEPYFVSLCTAEPRKNLALVLSAWTRSGLGREGVKLLLIGERGASGVFAEGQTLDLTAEGVLVTGHLPDLDVVALLSGAQALAYPSLYEGFGLPLLEAMACGAPVITTRLASLPEVAGECADYVDSSESDDLADVLRAYASRSEIDTVRYANGLARAAQFNWGASAELMSRIFNTL